MSAHLILRFEANDLFVEFVLLHLASVEEAETILANDPKLVIQADGLYRDCAGRELVMHGDGPDTADECGRWPEGVERWTMDAIIDNSVGVADFLTFDPVASNFRLVWFSMYGDSTGGIRRAESGCTDLAAS